jgi:hypothetical protein
MPHLFVPALDEFVPMGMYCTTTARYDQATGNNSWGQVTSMSARTDFPDTVISGNRLVLSTPAPSKITARLAWSGGGNDVGIAVNGVVVAFTSSDTTPQTVSYTFTPAAGDLVALVTNPGTTGVGNRSVQAGQTTSYLIAEPA